MRHARNGAGRAVPTGIKPLIAVKRLLNDLGGPTRSILARPEIERPRGLCVLNALSSLVEETPAARRPKVARVH